MFMYNGICRNEYDVNISVSPCSPNPCLNDGACTVDIYGEAVCTCNGERIGCDCSNKYERKICTGMVYG